MLALSRLFHHTTSTRWHPEILIEPWTQDISRLEYREIELLPIDKYRRRTADSESITFFHLCSHLWEILARRETLSELICIECRTQSSIYTVAIWDSCSVFRLFQSIEVFLIFHVFPLFCSTESCDSISFCIFMDVREWVLLIRDLEDPPTRVVFEDRTDRLRKRNTCGALEICKYRDSMLPRTICRWWYHDRRSDCRSLCGSSTTTRRSRWKRTRREKYERKESDIFQHEGWVIMKVRIFMNSTEIPAFAGMTGTSRLVICSK